MKFQSFFERDGEVPANPEPDYSSQITKFHRFIPFEPYDDKVPARSEPDDGSQMRKVPVL